MLRKREKHVLFELLENGRIPDKHVAKKLNTTQPTVTRIRQKLEREGYIKRYAAVPCLNKVGLDLVVFTLFQWMDYSKEDERKKAAEEVKNKPQTIYIGNGEGLSGKTEIIVSAHKSFNDYSKYIKELRKHWGKYVEHIDQFITPVDENYVGFKSGPAATAALSE